MPLLARLVDETSPDIVCLQETKCLDALFPLVECHALGFPFIEINGQAGYHGVATLSRVPLARVGTENFCGTGQARHLATQVSAPGSRFLLHNLYIPAGGDIADPDTNPKFAAKLRFLRALAGALQGDGEDTLLAGDFNVAPLEHDVWSHRQLLKVVSHTPIEIDHLAEVNAARSFVDVVRRSVPESEKLYSWWSYRARDWAASDRGRRLDHIWATPGLAARVAHTHILRDVRGWPRASDHVPVIADIMTA